MELPGLNIEALVVSRSGRRVLHGVSLTVGPGEVVALLGANGAGKSSLVMGAAGALPLDGGTVKLGKTQLSGLAPHRVREHRVATVPEGHRVLGELSVRDNLAIATPRELRFESELKSGLAIFPELEPLLKRPAGILSGGQKQMVAILQALMSRPAILLIDELSLGLAPTVVKRLVQTVRDIALKGVGVLIVEQFTNLALAVADRAYVLKLGRMTYDGSAADLRENAGILHQAYLSTRAEADDVPDAPSLTV